MTDHYVPGHLITTYRLLERSFGEVLPVTDYLPLLYVLGEKLNFVDTARVVSAFTSRQFNDVLDDIFRCHFTPSEASARVKSQLVGYEQWLLR